MSSAGQFVGGLVGGVAGFFLGGPTGAIYGAQIGMMAGGYLDPPKGPTVNGPRLSDLSVQTATYGAVIPRVYGAVTVNGNVFWLENNTIKETVTKKKTGGKGGGAKTTTRTYSYSATFAVGLCKGPIVGVRRIWVGPDLIYDAGSSDPATITASNQAASGFAIYTGTDTQSPDARIQATLGVANTPAWRGRAYIVFYDLQLARYGNSLMGAQVRVEVLTLGATYNYTYATTTPPSGGVFGRMAWNGSVFCAVSQSSVSYCLTSPDGVTWTAQTMPETNAWADIASNGSIFVALVLDWHVNYCYSSPDGITWTKRYFGFSSVTAGYHTRIVWSGSKFLVGTDDAQYVPFETSPDGITWTSQTSPFTGGTTALAWNGSVFLAVHSGSFYTSPSGNGGTWTLRQTLSGTNWSNACAKNGVFCVAEGNGQRSTVSSDGVTWTTYSGALPSNLNHGMATDGRVYLIGTGDGYAISNDGATWTYTAVTPVGSYQGTCFNGAKFALIVSAAANGIVVTPTWIGAIQPSLAQVVSAECLNSGLLTGGDIDVTALSQTVRGYRIGTVGAIRSALEPLQAAWPFDVRQHGYQIQFVARGGASVVTIPQADLDARNAGENPGVQITTSREMDSQLPRRVTVQHLDYDREYNTGSQYAERLNTAAINKSVLDLPIVLTATEAAGKAEVLLYLYWLERYDVAITLPPTYLQLEPGDVVTLVTPEGNVQLRLVEVDYLSDGRVQCKAKYANAAIYTPTAVASSPSVSGPTTITPVGASVYSLLDIPLLSSAQSGACFVAAMTGALAGWKGGVLMQSTDDGSTWASLQDFGPPGSVLGSCSNSLSSAESRMIDAGSTLTVTLTQGALYSVTQLAMLGGANHFAYGVDGRWEIIAAQTCTLVSGTTYTLTNFLRGRFGTEWAMGLHVNGDSLVLLDTTDLATIAMSSAAIGLPYLYRGITVDRDLSTDSNRSFTYQGVNLKPLSPIALTGSIDPGTSDWSLSWIRRTRSGGEWRDNVDASLGEDYEVYQVDIFADGTYATVKRTLDATSPAVTYSSAMQAADFGGNQSTLYLKVYQLSSSVGRGYPLTQSITR